MFLLTLSLMIGTAGLPHVIIRFFTGSQCQGRALLRRLGLVFIAILYTTAPAVGAMARLNLTNTIQTGPVGEQTANVEIASLPGWMKRWRTTGLLDWEDKNGDGRCSTTTTRTRSSRQGRRIRLEGQRDDQDRQRHHGARQPGDRQAAQLGHRPGRRRRSGRGALHRSGPAAGHLVRHLP